MRFGTMRVAVVAALMVAALPAGAKTIDRGDGIHSEDWFKNDSFLELSDDVAQAAQAGKGMVLIWEQPGCGSCQRLHDVNLQDPAVRAYLETHFDVMTMNMYGEQEVTAIDGTKMPEKDAAAESMINFTPTTVFLDETGKEVFRLPGYFQPFYWLAGFVYVHEKGYDDPEHRGMFPRWLKANRAKVVKAYGSDPKD